MAVTLARDGDLAVLTLDRPEALNALSFAIIREIGDALDRVAEDNSVRALLITGAGDKAFCAGADIKELRNRPLIEQKRGAELGQRVFAKLDELPVASIALVNGYAFGGGLELALACDLRAASTRAQIGLPEARVGMIPGAGGTQRLTRLCGPGVSARLILGGEVVDGAEAERLGIVEWAVEADALGAFVADTAVRAGGLSRQALLASKDCIAAWHDPQIDGFAREIEKPRELMPTQEARSRVLGFFRRKAG